MATRTCDRCGSRIQPRWPRKNVGGQMLCTSCQKNVGHIQSTAAGWSREDLIRHEIGRQKVHTVNGTHQLCPSHLKLRQSHVDFANNVADDAGLKRMQAPSVSPLHEGKCRDCAEQYGPDSKALPWDKEPGQGHRVKPVYQERQPTPHIDTDERLQQGRWPYREQRSFERFAPSEHLIPGIQSLNARTEMTMRAAIVVRPGREDRIQTKAKIRIQAHDSGDGETIFHCPFCGSGQVIARSDGTVECEFCMTAFTVQVQPQMPAFPQTIDGVPVQVPGMPAGGPGANVPAGDPGMDPMAADGPPGAEDPSEEPGDDTEDDGEDKPAFLKGSSLRTESGARISREALSRRLALTYLPDRERVLAQIRDENGAR